MDIDPKEIREKKIKLENNIFNLINTFNTTSGAFVKDLYMDTKQDNDTNILINITITVVYQKENK